MKSQPFATNWRVVLSLFASCGALALSAQAAIPACSSSNLPTGPTAYVAAPSLNQVMALDASTNTVACTIAVGGHPTNLAVSPDGSQLFVENDTDASVSVIDLTLGTVTSTISLTTSGVTAPMTANLAVSPDGTSVYVVSLPQTLAPTTQANLNVISLPSLSVSGAVSVVAPSPATPTPVTGPGLGIAFSPDATKAYLATEGLTYVVMTSNASVSAVITVNGGTAAVDPGGDFAYIVDVAPATNTTVSKITTATNAVSSLSPTPMCPLAGTTAITPDNAFAYYTCPGTGSDFVQKIDTTTNGVSTTVSLASGSGPQGIAITSDGASAYVANTNGSISVVSVSGNSATTPVTSLSALAGIGFRPVQLAISPTSQNVPTGTKFQFTSTLRFAFGTVTWSATCTASGAACGTVDSTGNYTAPNTIPSPNDVRVIATSTEIPLKSLKYPSQSVSAAVTITPSKLAFTVEPANGVAGVPLTNVTVSVEDADGNVVTDPTVTASTASITISSASTPNGAAGVTGTTTVTASGGVATFSNLILTQANIPPPSGSTTVTPYSYTLTATSAGLTSATSTPAITIAPAGAAELVFTTQPANGTAAIALGAVDLAVEDAFGNVVTSGPGSNTSITLSSTATNSAVCFAGGGGGGGGGGSPVIVGATGGIATFSGPTFTLAGSYALTAQSALTPSLLVSVTSSSFTIGAGPATQLVFKTEPVNGTAGIALAPVVVCVDDANNNVVTDPAVPASKASVMISSASAPSGATGVSGTTTVNATAGVATFSNLILSQVGTTPSKYSYTLTATSGALTPASSAPAITIVAGAAAKLVFAGSPVGSNGGLPIQNVSVLVEDAGNNIVTDPAVAASTASITISSASAPAGAASVSGTITVAASAGVANFSNLILTQVGTTPLATSPYNYTLTAKVSAPGALTGLATATSSSFMITPGAATQLAFAQPPASGVTSAGAPLPNVALYVEDAFSNVVTSGAGSNASIMVTPSSTPPGITTFAAGSTNPVTAVGGVATFSNLILTKANIPPPSGSTTVTPYGYTLAAASVAPALTGALSNSFAILPATATKLVYTTEPANGTAGLALGAVNVAVEDAFSNVVTSGPGSNASVTVSSTAAPVTPLAAALGGTITVSATAGIATFSNLILNQVGTTPLAAIPYNYTLTAASGGLASASSTPTIAVVPGAPSQLAFNTLPLTGTAGSPLAPVTVFIEDATGLNIVTTGSGSNASVSITSAATPAAPLALPVSGVATVSAAGGVATFSNLILTQVGTTPLATTKYSYTLTANSGGMASASSSSAITIVPGAATQLVFNAQPVSGTAAGSALSPVVMYVEDATGLNVVTSGPGSNALIAMAPVSTPSGVTTFSAGSTNAVVAVGGVATFNNLILRQANIPPPSGSTTVTPYSYTMAAASTVPALTTAPSNSFTIMPAAASKLAFTTQPVNGAAGSVLAPVFVSVEDQFGNVVTSDSSTVRMAVGAVAHSGEGGFTSDSTTGVLATGGIASFANLKPTRSAMLALSASDGALTGTASSNFVVAGSTAGLTPAGSAGSTQANPLSISGTQSATTVDLLGPAPTDGVTFTITCGSITVSGVTCVPTPSSTTGTASGITPISVALSAVHTSGSPPANPNVSPTLSSRRVLSPRGIFVFFVGMSLFGMGTLRWFRLHKSNPRYGLVFVLLLCLAIGWMSACTQFAAPNIPGTPVNPIPTGASGSAVVTIAPSGPGPGGDNFSQQMVTVYFQVQ